MTFIDYDRLEAIDTDEFRNRRPYPWINPAGLLTEEGYRRLLRTLPEPEKMGSFFGIERSHGQQPHDRFVLEYEKGIDVDEDWHAFIRELRGRRYRRFLQRMFGRRLFALGFHWHYTPNGCSVSPHCDAKHKLGSHIFYLNTAEDWRPEWGGETLILDDHGRFPRQSAPRFEDFDEVMPSDAIGNVSLLFARREKSWHGVREIHCPDNAYRKVFIVVVNDLKRTLRRIVKARLRGERASSY